MLLSFIYVKFAFLNTVYSSVLLIVFGTYLQIMTIYAGYSLFIFAPIGNGHQPRTQTMTQLSIMSFHSALAS